MEIAGELSEKPIVLGKVRVLFEFDCVSSSNKQIAPGFAKLLVQLVTQ